ncbi:hypothetical protein [Streptomyces auratus]|uniref:Uncharacterized protein n=1 Tax=Streptomyces auratus AGR0001 TaxID=1160718 RepID=A0A8B1NM36_9ACTN|nr:hypothetical protein [Streptomyces auratus]QTZ94694.1 hypothetical protein SU9_027290 [Streptomyces auratus AGR0001]
MPSPAPSPQADHTAACLYCAQSTEYPLDHPGTVLCPVCEWQEAQRCACSG